MWLILCILVSGILSIFCIRNHLYWKRLFFRYHPLYKNKLWLIWEDDSKVFASKAFQYYFKSKEMDSIMEMLSHFDNSYYNQIIHNINFLENQSFQITVFNNKNYWQVSGSYHKPLYVVEFSNINDFMQTIQEKEEQNTVHTKTLQRYKASLDYISVPFCIKNRKQEITYCNFAYAKLFNSSVINVLDLQLRFDNPEPPTPKERSVKVALNGKLHCFTIHSQPLPFDDSTLETSWEKTDFFNLTKDFEEQKHYFQDVFQQLSTAIAVFNQKMQLEFWNNAYSVMFKCDEEFLQKKPLLPEILDDLHMRQKLPEPEDFSQYKNNEIKTVSNLIESVSEVMHLPNGQILRHNKTPLISGVIFLYEDITDTYYLIQKNKILSDVQKYTIDNLHEGILVFGADHCVQLSNPSAVELFALDIGERFHINHFLQQTQSLLPEEWLNQLLTIFARRAPKSGVLQHKLSHIPIQWAYTALPDGSHMLRFMNQKKLDVQNFLKP